MFLRRGWKREPSKWPGFSWMILLWQLERLFSWYRWSQTYLVDLAYNLGWDFQWHDVRHLKRQRSFISWKRICRFISSQVAEKLDFWGNHRALNLEQGQRIKSACMFYSTLSPGDPVPGRDQVWAAGYGEVDSGSGRHSSPGSLWEKIIWISL